MQFGEPQATMTAGRLARAYARRSASPRMADPLQRGIVITRNSAVCLAFSTVEGLRTASSRGRWPAGPGGSLLVDSRRTSRDPCFAAPSGVRAGRAAALEHDRGAVDRVAVIDERERLVPAHVDVVQPAARRAPEVVVALAAGALVAHRAGAGHGSQCAGADELAEGVVDRRPRQLGKLAAGG